MSMPMRQSLIDVPERFQCGGSSGFSRDGVYRQSHSRLKPLLQAVLVLGLMLPLAGTDVYKRQAGDQQAW